MFTDSYGLRNLCVFGIEATSEDYRLIGYDSDGSTFEVRKLILGDENKGKYFRHGGTITGIDFSGRTYVAPYSKHIEELLKEKGFTEAVELPSILGNNSDPRIVGTRRWVNGEMKTGRKYYEGQIYHLNNNAVSSYDPQRYNRLKRLETHPMGSEVGMAWNNISFLTRLEHAVGYDELKKIGLNMGINIDDFYNTKVIDSPSHPESGYYFVTSLEANEQLVKLAERVQLKKPEVIDSYVIGSYDVSKMPTTIRRLGKEYDVVDVVLNEQNSRYKEITNLVFEATDIIRKLENISAHPTKDAIEKLEEIQKTIRNKGIDILVAHTERLKKECEEHLNRNKDDSYSADMIAELLPRVESVSARLEFALKNAKTVVANVKDENAEQPGGPQ